MTVPAFAVTMGPAAVARCPNCRLTKGDPSMEFIELSGKALMRVVGDEQGLRPQDLARVGVTDESVVRVNRQGDVELRRANRWDVVGGLLGDFEQRIKEQTGLDWQ